MACGIELNDTEAIPPRFMTAHALKVSDVLSWKDQDGKLVYNRYHSPKQSVQIVLPCTNLSSLSSVQNVEFAYPPHVFSIAATLPEDDEPEVEVEDEPEVEPEEYFFEEFTHPRMGNPTKEAHSRIGKLQKIGKWLVRKVKGLSKEKTEWAKEREELRKEMAEIKGRLSGELPRDQDPPLQRRHSVSVEETYAPVKRTPARHSSAEARTQRKKKPSLRELSRMRYVSSHGEGSSRGNEQTDDPGSYDYPEMSASTAYLFDL